MSSPAATRTIRLPAELLEEAEQEAEFFKRSISGQVEHWATLGRAIEGSPGFTLDRTRAALNGQFDADQLSSEERVFFDEALGQSFATPSPDVEDYFAGMAAKGGGVGYDDEGRLVRGLPDGGSEVID